MIRQGPVNRGPPNCSYNLPTKQLVILRLSRDVLDPFRATGPGWQRRIDEVLRRAIAGTAALPSA